MKHSIKKEKLHPYYDSDYLFQLLLSSGLISREQIDSLTPKLSVPMMKGWDIVQWLDSLHLPKRGKRGEILDESDIIHVVSQDKGWMFRRLDPLRMDMDVVTKTVPASFAKRRLVIPYAWQGDELEVVCYDPLDMELQEDLKRVCNARLRISVAPRKDIERIIQEFFGFKKSIADAQSLLQAPVVDISNLEQYIQITDPQSAATDRHIQVAVDHLFQYALRERASDIHIEPKRKESWIRIRIDGVLHVIYRLPKVVHDAICTRIKAMSRLDISEKRRPQDGRIKVSWKDSEAEVRVSTVPVAFGEKVVLRLQSAEILFSDLNKLGLSERDFEVYKGFLKHTYGIILMTGPTGSGKSTTLYSTLRHLNSPEVNIVTIEDPIEMVYEDFNQIAVQPHIDVTFSTILRNILRQDPDIIMLGEIRDQETARYAVQAALTGHLVFSTLHTNDSISAITRLRDLGLETYLISSTLLGVVAQRLVRMVCTSCGEIRKVSSAPLNATGLIPDEEYISVNVGKGCSRCRHTGYWGRIGIYEVFPVSDAIKEMIHKKADETVIRKQAIKEGMKPLAQDGYRKILSGITSIEEVVKTAAS